MKRKILISLLTIWVFSITALSFAANSNSLQAMGRQGDNAIITTKIKTLMLKDDLLSPFNIGVTTKDDGVVYLKGNVSSEMQYEQAVMLAESVAGVSDVNTDNFKIKINGMDMKNGSQYFTDTLITGKINGKILQEKIFGDKDVKFWNVNVETRKGVVYLYGWVENEQQKNNIANIAKNTKDVKSIQNKLLVK